MILNRNPWFSIAGLVLAAMLAFPACSGSESVGKKLNRLGLAWEQDAEGDYRIDYPLEDGRTVVVGVGAHSLGLGSEIRVRELWSVAARIPGDFPGDLAENLLSDSWSTRKLGSWALAGRTSDGRSVLVYVARVPEGASLRLFRAALEDVAVSAADMGDALEGLEDGR